MMKKVTIILCLMSFWACCNINAQTPGENIDVTHYEIHLSNFNFTDHTLQGETYVTLNATANTSTIVLELKTLTVNAVLCETPGFGINGFNQDDDLLTITLSETLPAGQSITLDILYGGNTFNESWGGIMWTSGYVCNMGVGFESIPHNLGKCWFPCVDNFTDKATYNINITVPNLTKAICGGNLLQIEDPGDDTRIWHYEVPQEVATYHVSFAIGDYVTWEDTYNGIERDIPIEVSVKPNQINAVDGTFVHVKDIAAFYEDRFGPYPFNRIGYVITSVGCMEHIDNIGITSGVLTGNTSQEEYVAHELSHMYFGNKTTCSTAGDMWLNEGFAQFCGLFYRSSIYGEDDFQQAMSAKINSIASWCKNESNWIPLNNMPLDMTYDGTAVYNRGAVIVNTMMNYMGRENFLAGIRHYLETYAYGAASSEQLRDALTEATGIDLNGFFDTYVFIGGMPHYTVCLDEVTPANDNQFNAKILLRYQHVGPSHVGQNNRVEVTFVSNDRTKETKMACWDGQEGEQTFTLDFSPIAVFIDYDNHFLDAKLDKNLWAVSPTTFSVSNKFQAVINSVNNASMLRIEEHLVGPGNPPSDPAYTLSTYRYWDFFRTDFNEADIDLFVTYSKSLNQDNDIIHTENDSAVLLYRTNFNDHWHSIPYTQEGTWKNGRFTVNNPQSGQYTIAVIDKTQMGFNEHNEPAIRVYPNPSHGTLMGQTGEYQITNLSGQAMKKGMAQGQIDVSNLSSGTYFLTINGITQKFVIQ